MGRTRLFGSVRSRRLARGTRVCCPWTLHASPSAWLWLGAALAKPAPTRRSFLPPLLPAAKGTLLLFWTALAQAYVVVCRVVRVRMLYNVCSSMAHRKTNGRLEHCVWHDSTLLGPPFPPIFPVEPAPRILAGSESPLNGARRLLPSAGHDVATGCAASVT